MFAHVSCDCVFLKDSMFDHMMFVSQILTVMSWAGLLANSCSPSASISPIMSNVNLRRDPDLIISIIQMGSRKSIYDVIDI